MTFHLTETDLNKAIDEELERKWRRPICIGGAVGLPPRKAQARQSDHLQKKRGPASCERSTRKLEPRTIASGSAPHGCSAIHFLLPNP